MNKFREQKQEKQIKSKPGKATGFLYSLLDGSFLNKESSIKHLPYTLLLFSLGLIYIYMSHSSEKKTREYNRLSNAVKELQSEYISLKSELTYKSNQTQLAKELEPFKIKEASEPPKQLKIKLNK
jgi:hypothetical protein